MDTHPILKLLYFLLENIHLGHVCGHIPHSDTSGLLFYSEKSHQITELNNNLPTLFLSLSPYTTLYIYNSNRNMILYNGGLVQSPSKQINEFTTLFFRFTFTSNLTS